MELPADGSNDTGDLYKITRRDTSQTGNISIEAYTDTAEVYITLENIEKITLYFNETDVDLEKYTSWVGGDIDIIIDNDGSELDGEFHGVPDPDKVGVETSWIDYSYNDGVFSFNGLETSTTTITLSYDGWVSSLWGAIMVAWAATFLVFILKLIYGIFSKITY